MLQRGREADSVALFEERLDEVLAAIRHTPVGVVGPPGFRAYVGSTSGHLAQVREAGEDLNRQALKGGAGWVRGFACFLLGFAARLQGLGASAERWLGEAAVLVPEVDVTGLEQACLAELAHAQALMGRVSEAAGTLEKPFHGLSTYHFTHIAPARIWVVAARGEVFRARSIALDEAATAAAAEWFAMEAALLHDAARLGAAREVAGRIAALATQIEGPVTAAYAAHSVALAAGDAPGLEAASRSFEELGYLLLAAEAAAEAARAYEGKGRRGTALGARRRASALAARCEGSRTPALTEIEVTLPLTAREKEVATLAARGMSNAAIGDTLGVSVRTVENHLHRVFAQLGVTARAELASILGDAGAP